MEKVDAVAEDVVVENEAEVDVAQDEAEIKHKKRSAGTAASRGTERQTAGKRRKTQKRKNVMF